MTDAMTADTAVNTTKAATDAATVPSLGLRALLLIRLDGHAGEFVTVQTLASTYRLTPASVRAGLLSLHVEGYVTCHLAPDGEICAARSVAAG